MDIVTQQISGGKQNSATMADQTLQETVKQLQQQVQSLQEQVKHYQSHTPSYNHQYVRDNQYVSDILFECNPCTKIQSLCHQISDFQSFDPELTSIPYWYRNSPIFQYHGYYPQSNYNANTNVYDYYNYHQQNSTMPTDDIKQQVTQKMENKENVSTNEKPKKRKKNPKSKRRGNKIDINDQETLKNLGVSSELMNFFYNGEIRRNRLRIEKMERERAEIESIPTIKQQQINETKRRNNLYGKDNNYKLKQKEIAMDADFLKILDEINVTTTKKDKLVSWPATPLSY